jgi:hypothetical protein
VLQFVCMPVTRGYIDLTWKKLSRFPVEDSFE